MSIDDVLSACIIAIACAALVAVVGSRTQTTAPALAAYGIRLGAGTAVFVTFGLLSNDAIYYDTTAIALLSDPSSVTVTIGKEGWPVLLAALYAVFGHLPLLGIIINAAAGGITASLVGVAASLIGASPRVAGWFAALLPSSIIWSSLLLRESISWLLLVIICVGFLQIGRRLRTSRGVALIAIATLALFAFRGSLAVIVLCAGTVGAAFMRRETPRWVFAGILTLPLVLITPLGTQVIGIFQHFTIDRLDTSREVLASSATGWPVTEHQGAYSFVETILIGAPRMSLGPYPWEWGVVGAPLALDAAAWLAVLLLTVRGWRLLPKRRTSVLLLVSGAVLAVLIATSGNYGTAQRLRMQSQVLLLPVAAAGLMSASRPVLDSKFSSTHTRRPALR